MRQTLRAKRVFIIGAGIGGLTAAVELAARGFEPVVIEAADRPGGKMSEIEVGGLSVDAGPTVLTMRDVFEDVFENAGVRLSDYVTLKPAKVLARHAWEAGGQLDLLDDVNASADAIGQLSGASDARAYLSFCAEAEAIYRVLDKSFIKASKPNLPQLIARIGPHRVRDLWRINPYQTVWQTAARHFRDPRLRQLFARYATYCGSSPFMAPATLMLIAHVERCGVWLVEGGMYEIAKALVRLGETLGIVYRFGERVTDISVSHGRVSGIALASGERLAADMVISNADVFAVAEGRLGYRASKAVGETRAGSRSLSALTWAITGTTDGFPLSRHTLFFSDAPYRAEFDAIFKRANLPESPVVYVCAQDRDAHDGALRQARERFFCIVNAPGHADSRPLTTLEIDKCERTMFRLLQACGLRMTPADMVRTAPQDFERRFPGTGGAIYGRASHGWMASFRRQGARSRMPGLYLAGGSTHPGPGVPMAALSGRLAAEALATDYVLARQFHTTAMPGGISMPSAATGVTD